MNRKIKARLFTLILCMTMLLGTATMVYADFVIDKEFKYTSHYPGYRNPTSYVEKNDNSSAIAMYLSGAAEKMYFELWALNPDTKATDNYTLRHLDNGIYVTHYTARIGHYTQILNLVYETFKKPVDTKLVAYIYATGEAWGFWNPSIQ